MLDNDSKILVIKLYSGSYVRDNGREYGHESLNLVENNGYFYGIVNGWKNTQDVKNVDINKIGQNINNKDYIDDVLIVYFEEDLNYDVKIVAFAIKSRVYRRVQNGLNLNRNILNAETGKEQTVGYHIVTEKNDMYQNLKYSYVIDFKKYFDLKSMFRDQKSYLDNPHNLKKLDNYQKLKKEIINYVNLCINDCEYEFDSDEIENSVFVENSNSYLEQMKLKSVAQGFVPEKKAWISKKSIIDSNYQCVHNNNHKTFITNKGNPYMEGHHLIRCTKEIADKIWNKYARSIDTEFNIVSLCPNCHRLIHYGNKEEKKRILDDLYQKRITSLESIGINISLNELYEYYNL